MLISCTSCNTMLRIDQSLVKKGGSTVRCAMCTDLFMVYLQEDHIESQIQGKTNNNEMATTEIESGVPDNQPIENNEPTDDLEGDDIDFEFAELPDLSVIEEIVDSLFDEKDHINYLSPEFQEEYSLIQDINFSGDYQSKQINRRKHNRVKTQNLISYFAYDEKDRLISHGFGIALDISKGGILLETFDAIGANQIVLMATDSEKNIIEIKGQLKYSKASTGETYLSGIEYIGSDNQAVDFITKLIREYNSHRYHLFITPRNTLH